MADFDEILGNESVKEHFKAAVLQQRVSHSYIIEGEKGSGKKMLAGAFSKILQCENNNVDACGRCESCLQAEHKTHPDILWVGHEKPGVISVGEIREQVVNTMDVSPYKGPYKIYIIDEAEKMNPAAQNALLKTIEEPPPYGIILLLTTNRGVFLPTILSRCVLLTVKPVPTAKIKNYLMTRQGLPESRARFCAEFSMGNLGKAVRTATSEAFTQMRDLLLSILRNLDTGRPKEIGEAVKEGKSGKDAFGDFLDLILLWYRDILVYKTDKEKDRLLFKEEAAYIKKQSEKLSYEHLNEIFCLIEQARGRLYANVNYEAVLERMFLDIANRYRKPAATGPERLNQS